MGFCSCSAKYLVFIFNFLVVILSVALIVIGGLAYKDGQPLMDVGDWKLKAPSLAVIILGIVVFIIAFMGCCGAIQENSCMITTYSLLLLTLLVLEILVGVLALVYEGKVQDELGHMLSPLYEQYSTNTDSKATVDSIQSTFKCCGLSSPSDPFGLIKPQSCCKDPTQSMITCELPGNYWPEGCQIVVINTIQKALKTAGWVIIVFGCIELIGVILGFCLATHFKNEARRNIYS